jgi:bacterioferritin (cytochrome b1)
MSRNVTGQTGHFPLDNLTYDIITILYEKSKALEAYDKYLQDAQGDQQIVQLFEQIRKQDEQHIQQLQQHLGRVIGKGTAGGATAGNVKP